jgi:NAD(P)-dependent dehydrogenase (short-subunit alcohol dehydrogenase family)
MPDRNLASYPSLAGRTVLVSGGASGIGEALVRAFAGQGARVGFVDIMAEQGAALADELRGDGGEVLFLPADLTDIAALKAAVARTAAELGPITVLVNNAANDTRHDWRTETPESWDARIAVNLKHFFFAIQAVAPGMIEAGGGSIVNFGSISWMLARGGMPVYTTAKAAVHGMTRSFARDLGQHRIRVNTVLPGWVMTERQLKLWFDAEGEEELKKAQCLPDRLMPDHLARAVLFLASDDSAMISAQNIIVDGGWV